MCIHRRFLYRVWASISSKESPPPPLCTGAWPPGCVQTCSTWTLLYTIYILSISLNFNFTQVLGKISQVIVFHILFWSCISRKSKNLDLPLFLNHAWSTSGSLAFYWNAFCFLMFVVFNKEQCVNDLTTCSVISTRMEKLLRTGRGDEVAEINLFGTSGTESDSIRSGEAKYRWPSSASALNLLLYVQKELLRNVVDYNYSCHFRVKIWSRQLTLWNFILL